MNQTYVQKLVAEVIATEGKTKKRVAWLKYQAGGIYFGWCKKGEDFHISYHSNGNVFWSKENAKATLIRKAPPLSVFTGLQQLVGGGFLADLPRLNVVEYKPQRVDFTLYIDTQKFHKGAVGLLIFLGVPETITNLLAFPPGAVEKHIWKERFPWIVFILHHVQVN